MKDISELMLKVGELHIDEYLSGKSIVLFDCESILSENEYKYVLRQMSDEDLAKLHRALVLSESYESISLSELNRRGFVITINQKNINYKRHASK